MPGGRIILSSIETQSDDPSQQDERLSHSWMDVACQNFGVNAFLVLLSGRRLHLRVPRVCMMIGDHDSEVQGFVERRFLLVTRWLNDRWRDQC